MAKVSWKVGVTGTQRRGGGGLNQVEKDQNQTMQGLKSHV